MLILQDVSYTHPNKDILFKDLSFSITARQKVALIGNNGVGKSTLLKIIAGERKPATGVLQLESEPYYIPQVFGQFNHVSIAQALNIDGKLAALKEIIAGNVSDDNLTILNDDWTIEERCIEALHYWKLDELDWQQKLETLSGGQKTKVFLSGIIIHRPQLVLLDEPSNHLDTTARQLLYDFIETTTATLMVVSHDRKLLNLLDTVFALTAQGVKFYGGNYDFYLAQKKAEGAALEQDLQSKEKELRKAKQKERDTMERQQRMDARGKGKQEKAGMARIMMNTLRNKAENSTAKAKAVHGEKIEQVTQQLQHLRAAIPDIDKMKIGFDHSDLHKGKLLFTATGINYRYGARWLWNEPLDLEIVSGERIAIKGNNGSGKTTLIRLVTGNIEPRQGNVFRAATSVVYIDQDYSLIDNRLTVYEQAQQYNPANLMEHEVKIRLNRFLFGKEQWEKLCAILSGGERMRLALCCLALSPKAPDIIILDEPTNNLDIQNVEILTAAINEYQGTVIMVSHDEQFLRDAGITRWIEIGNKG